MIYRLRNRDFVALFTPCGELAGDKLSESDLVIVQGGGIPSSWCSISGNDESIKWILRDLDETAEDHAGEAAFFRRLAAGIRAVAEKFEIAF